MRRSTRDALGQYLSRHLRLRRLLSGGVVVTHMDVPIPNLPEDLDGLRLVHISDVHVGEGLWEPEYAADAARALHQARPHVVVNTGDYLQGEPAIEKVTSLVGQFVIPPDQTPFRPANLGILGNHDYYADDNTILELIRHLESLGTTVLVNRVVCVRSESAGITFGGFTLDAPGFRQAVEALLAADRPRIAMVHEPDVVEDLPAGAADLVLAGHTHAGQISLPGVEPFIVRRFCGSRYVRGWYRVGGMPMYVNRGLGCTGLPLRFRAPPEVGVFRLVR